MLIESFVVSVVVGAIRGGRLKRISYIRFRYAWIFILAVLIQLGIVFISMNNVALVSDYIIELYVFSYILLFIGIIMNLKYKSLWIIILGGAMNLFSFLANAGRIPVSLDSLKLAGLDELATFVETGDNAIYASITEATKYSYLGDIITIPQPYPYPQILSIGDVFIALGLFIFIQSIMLNRKLDRSTMVRFKYKNRLRI